MPAAAQVYAVIKNNGAVRNPPCEAQLRLYADLIVQKGARFDVSDYAKSQWGGRSSWQMAKMIDGLKSEPDA